MKASGMNRSFIWIALILISRMATAQEEADEILRSHLRVSNQELWEQIRTVAIDGRWVDENYRGYKMRMTLKQPQKIRIEGTWNQKKYIEAFDGTNAWMLAPWTKQEGIEEATPAEQVVLMHSYHIGSPLAAFQDGLQFVGYESLDGTIYNTFVAKTATAEIRFYLSRDSHQVVHKKVTATYGQETVELIFTYEKYRSYSGLNIPVAVLINGADYEREFVFDEIIVGPGASDAFFQPPQ